MAEVEKLPDKLMIEQNKLVDINKQVMAQEAHTKRVGAEDRKQKISDAVLDANLQRVKREFNSKEATDARDKIALDRIIGREKKEQINAIHAALEADILTAKNRIKSHSIQQQAIHALNQQYHNKRLALEDDDKTASLQNEAEIAENRGKTIQKLLLDEKTYRSEKLHDLHQGNIDEDDFQKLTQAKHVETQKKIADTRREAFQSLRELQHAEINLVQDATDKRKNLLRELADSERNYAHEQLKFIKERKDAERSLTDTIRNELEARENLASHRENKAIRQRLAAIVNEQPAGRTVTGAGGSTFISQGKSIRDQIYQAQLRSIGAENPALGKGQVADLAAQETQRQIREMEDLASSPGGAMKVSEKLRGQGINLSREQQGQLAALSVRQGIAEQGQQGAEEQRADEAAERAVADASRAVADAQDHLKDTIQREADARQDFIDRQTKLQEELTKASRDYGEQLISLREEARKAAEALRGIGAGRPAAIDAAAAMPAFSRLGRGSSKFIGVGLPRGIAGPPTPLDLMPGMQNIRERVMGSFEEFRSRGMARATSVFGGPITGLGELQNRAMATGNINVGGEADRIIGDLFPDTKKNRVSSLPGVNLQGQTVSKETAEMLKKGDTHININIGTLGSDTKEAIAGLGKKLERDARRTP